MLHCVTQGNTEIPKLTGKNKIVTITAKAWTTWKGGADEGKLHPEHNILKLPQLGKSK